MRGKHGVEILADPYFDLLHDECEFTLEAAVPSSMARLAKSHGTKTEEFAKWWSGERVFFTPPPDAEDLWIAKAMDEVAGGCPLAVCAVLAQD